MYRSETWAMTVMDWKRMRTWEEKILRRMYAPMIEQGIWRIRKKSGI
jgi:hypothetical protein